MYKHLFGGEELEIKRKPLKLKAVESSAQLHLKSSKDSIGPFSGSTKTRSPPKIRI